MSFDDDNSKRSLWCGKYDFYHKNIELIVYKKSWTHPFDGGGRTSLEISETIFDDQIVQMIYNPYYKSFYARSSAQQGKDWNLWQKTEPTNSESQGHSIACLFNNKLLCLIHLSLSNDQITFRTSSDIVLWTKWTNLASAKTTSRFSLIIWKSKAFVYFLGINKKFYYTSSDNGDLWSKVEEIKNPPPISEFGVKKVHITSTLFENNIVLTIVCADIVYVSETLDGKTFSKWNCGGRQETNQPVETKAFINSLYQARIGFDEYVHVRNSNGSNLEKWLPWITSPFKTFSPISMVVYNHRLIMAVHGNENEVYVRSTEDGRYWTKWSIVGDERRKTKSSLTQIIYKNSLYQSLISLDNFVLSRVITNKIETYSAFKIDDTIVASNKVKDQVYFQNLFLNYTFVQLKSVGSDANYVSKALELNKTITHLDLSSSHIENEGALMIFKAISNHPFIKILNLRDNQINGYIPDLQFLINGHKPLRSLDLSSNRIGDEGAKDLLLNFQNSHSLTHIYLSDNQIEILGAQALGEALLVTNTLQHIAFSKNFITNDGLQNICNSLQQNKSLTSLELSNNGISLEGSKHLTEMIKKNCTIKKLIFSKQNLKRNEASRQIADSLKLNDTLTHIDFSHNHIGSEGVAFILESLSQNQKIENLNLDNNDIEDEGLLNIHKYLNLNKSLTTISFRKNDFRRIGTTALANSLMNCQLKSLDLSHCFISFDGLKALMNVLKTNTFLTDLKLSNCQLGNNEAYEIFSSLKSSVYLKLLELENNKFTDEGLKNISSLIQANPRISDLSLWGNVIYSPLIKIFSSAIKENTYLINLMLEVNAPENEMEDLALSLRTKQNLAHLMFKGKLSSKNVSQLSSLLLGNTYIQSICLFDCGIDDNSVQIFVSCFKDNKTLKTLNLKKNKIETQGIISISNYLNSNTTLTSLDLSQNNIGFDSVEILSNLLRNNKNLIELIIDIEYNNELDFAY